MIVHRKIINAPSRVVRIRPFGDLQKEHTDFQTWLWERWKRESVADKDSYFIGMGDYTDSFRPTIRKTLEIALKDDEEAHTQLDKEILNSTYRLAEEMMPLRNRIIGLCEGHHYHRTTSGKSSTVLLCERLGVPYLGKAAWVQLVVRTGGKNSFAIDIFATHGSGGAKKLSGDLRQAENDILPNWDVDIILRGHSTRAYTAPLPPLTKISQNRGGSGKPFLYERKRWLANTGGFLAAYQEGTTSYVEDALLPKVALGWTELEVKERHHNAQGQRFEIKGTTIVP